MQHERARHVWLQLNDRYFENHFGGRISRPGLLLKNLLLENQLAQGLRLPWGHLVRIFFDY